MTFMNSAILVQCCIHAPHSYSTHHAIQLNCPRVKGRGGSCSDTITAPSVSLPCLRCLLHNSPGSLPRAYRSAMSAADRVPVEVWARIAEHLLRPLPANKVSDWDELHQHDLVTLMRVSKVGLPSLSSCVAAERQAICTATGPLLYRCAVVKDICALTYGLDRPDTDEDEAELADENDAEPRGRTRGKRCSKGLQGLPPPILRPTVETPGFMHKERLLSFVRHLHLVYINGGLLEVVNGAMDSDQPLDNNSRPGATQQESQSALVQWSEAFASSLRALRVLRPLQLSKLSLGAYGKQEPRCDRCFKTASLSIQAQIDLVHKASFDFVRHSRPITICQHRRIYASTSQRHDKCTTDQRHMSCWSSIAVIICMSSTAHSARQAGIATEVVFQPLESPLEAGYVTELQGRVLYCDHYPCSKSLNFCVTS